MPSMDSPPTYPPPPLLTKPSCLNKRNEQRKKKRSSGERKHCQKIRFCATSLQQPQTSKKSPSYKQQQTQKKRLDINAHANTRFPPSPSSRISRYNDKLAGSDKLWHGKQSENTTARQNRKTKAKCSSFATCK